MDSNNFSTPLPAEIWDIILGYTNLEHSFLIAENSEDIENLNNAISDESFRALEKVNKVFYKYLSSKQLNLCTAFIFDSSWREKINISRVLFLSQDSLQTSFFINLHFKSILRCKTLLSSVVEKVALQGRTLCLNHFSIEDIDSKIRELALIETSFKVKKNTPNQVVDLLNQNILSLNSLESLSLIDIQVSKNDKKEILNLLSEKKIKNLTLYGFDCALNTEIRSSLLELLSNDYYERLNIYALDFPGPYSDLLDICENREKPLTICFNCNFSSQQVPLMSTMLPMNVSEILRVEFLEHLEIEGFSEDLELIEHGSLDIDQDNRNTTVKKLSFIKCVISETFLEFFLESMQGCFELNFYGGTFILGDNNVPLENDRIEILRIHNSLVTEEDDIVSCLSLDFTSLRALELINTNCSVDDIDFILEGNFGLKNIVLLDNAMMENKAAYLAHKLMETLQLNPFIASIEVRFIDIDRFKDFADEIMDYSTDNGSLLSDYIYSLDREQKLFILTS